jgi:hypothetical protein
MILAMLKLWKTLMRSHADIVSLVASAKPADLVELEAQLDEAQASLNATNRDLAAAQEDASAAYSTPFKLKDDVTMAAAAEKVKTLTATATAIQKTLSEIRRKIETARPASISSIHAALAPVRQQAANDIAISARSFYEAVARYNATSAALDRNGAHTPQLPAAVPILDHIVDRVTKGC